MNKWVVGVFLCSGLSAFAQDGADPKDKVTPSVEIPTSGALQINSDWWRDHAWSTTTRLGALVAATLAGRLVLGEDLASTTPWVMAMWMGSQILHDAFREGWHNMDAGWFLRKSVDAVVRGVIWNGIYELMPGGIVPFLIATYVGDVLYETVKAAIFGGPRPVKKQEGVAQKIGALAD